MNSAENIKIFAVTCIANEEDIIESFVRINSKFINHFFFVDDSKDGTGDILENLKSEGFHITRLFRNKAEEYRQDYLINSTIRFIKDNYSCCDYILPLDSDEFPEFHSVEHAHLALTQIGPNSIGYYAWRTYVPINNFHEISNSSWLINNFKSRNPEGTTYYKIIIPFKLVDKITVHMGSHDFTQTKDTGTPIQRVLINTRLAHFPVRSSAQILLKTLHSCNIVMRKNSKKAGEGAHAYQQLTQLIKSNYKLNLPELQNISMKYANDDNSTTTTGVHPNWIDNYEIVYTKTNTDQIVSCISDILIGNWLAPINSGNTNDLLMHIPIETLQKHNYK